MCNLVSQLSILHKQRQTMLQVSVVNQSQWPWFLHEHMQKNTFRANSDQKRCANEEEVFCGEEGLRGFRGTSVSLSVHFRSQNCRRDSLCLHCSQDTASFGIHRHFSNRSKRLVIPASSHSFYCQIELVVSVVAFLIALHPYIFPRSIRRFIASSQFPRSIQRFVWVYQHLCSCIYYMHNYIWQQSF